MFHFSEVIVRPHRWRYAFSAYRALPVTFVRRVLLGRDPYWRQYFWSRWGFVPQSVIQAAAGRDVLWIDALSGGEVTQAVTFCRMLRDALPEWVLILSTNNRYSYEFARTNMTVDFVLDSPWDCRVSTRRALDSLQPKAVVAIESLTCPVLIKEAKRRGIMTVFVSAIMSKGIDRHPMYHRIIEERPFTSLDSIGAKNLEDVRGFLSQGVAPERVVVTGNMKFDLEFLRVSNDEREQFRKMLGISAEEPVLLAASLHQGEEELVLDAYLEAKRTVPALRLLLVPRYQFDIPKMSACLDAKGTGWVLKSALPPGEDRGRPVIVDTFGELTRLYSIASVVFLGGSTYQRNAAGLGQNLIEPLAQRRPVFFGPFMNLWTDITKELQTVWPGLEITTAKELAAGVIAALCDPVLRARLERKIDEILDSHRDDVRRNVEVLLRALSRKDPKGSTNAAGNVQ